MNKPCEKKDTLNPHLALVSAHPFIHMQCNTFGYVRKFIGGIRCERGKPFYDFF